MHPPRSNPITSGIVRPGFALIARLETDRTAFTETSLLPSDHLFHNSTQPRESQTMDEKIAETPIFLRRE
jgi:hypothetical protein